MNITRVFCLILLCASCAAQTNNITQGYNLSKPAAFYILPDTLYEISGLTDVDANRIGCVQDEKGMIFLYNLVNARIDTGYTFYFDGDYEGITRVGNDMFVLRSDGKLFRVTNYMLGQFALRDSFATGIPITNNEGLCFDEKNNTLLIAAKGRMKASKDARDLRFVYAFSLDSLKTKPAAAFTIDINDVAAAMKNKGIAVSHTVKKNGTVRYDALKFMPSSIAIHPRTNHVFILSAVDRLLVILNRNGAIEDVAQLDAVLFPKPEGITFLPNGDMLIANEGNGGKPNLMRFSYR